MTALPASGKPSRKLGRRLAHWFLLGLAVAWSAALRIPLILNASAHLDSDLAVDGLTLLEATQGAWRWHYPGTPYMGTGSLILSWVQTRIWGVDPITLVSGGTVAYLMLLLSTFLLGWRVYGRSVALWSLAPLTFASTGTLWLSGRITGGHLLIAAWSAGAWLLLYAALSRTSLARRFLLSFWCGMGLYLDSMFLLTLSGVLVVGAFGCWRPWKAGTRTSVEVSSGSKPPFWKITVGLVLIVGFVGGLTPRFIGLYLAPHGAYREQFSWSLEPRSLAEHVRILTLECLPRLLAGHRLPGFESDPDPALLGSGAPIQRSSPGRQAPGWRGPVVTFLAFAIFM